MTNNNQPLEESKSFNSGILNPGNVKPLTNNNQPLEESKSSLNSGLAPNNNNVSSYGGTLTNNNQPLEESTSLNRGITPNTLSHVNGTNNVSSYGGTLTANNEPLKESTSLNGITPTGTPGANTNQVLDKESQLRAKLQKLIEGDQECNALYDDTIITWKNIVDRTKSIVENFGKSRAETTTTTTVFEICGNNQDDDGDGLIDETCPGFVLPPEDPSDGIDNDGDRLIDETGSQPIIEICAR